MRYLFILILAAGVNSLAVASAKADTFTMVASGNVEDASSWSTTPAFPGVAGLTSADILNINSGFAGIFSSSNQQPGWHDATMNVNGTGSLTPNGNRIISNLIVNVNDSATFFSSNNGNFRMNDGFIVNYNSSATSTSTGAFALRESGAEVHVNSGGLVLTGGTSRVGLTNVVGGLINLNGGDVSFASFNFGDAVTNPSLVGSIDFKFGQGSTMSYTNATAMTDLDEWITSGFIQVNGVTAGLANFNRSFDGSTNTLTITPTGVPEPGSATVIAFGLAAVMVRRRRS